MQNFSMGGLTGSIPVLNLPRLAVGCSGCQIEVVDARRATGARRKHWLLTFPANTTRAPLMAQRSEELAL